MDDDEIELGRVGPAAAPQAIVPEKERLLWNASRSIASSLGRVILCSQDQVKSKRTTGNLILS